MMYRRMFLSLFGLFGLFGCQNVNRENVAMFMDIAERMDAAGQIINPDLEFYYKIETSVGVRLNNFSAAGNAAADEGESVVVSPVFAPVDDGDSPSDDG